MVDIHTLEGWLVKKHSGDSFSISTESKRWFKVKSVKGIEHEEFVLGYYASQKTKEAKGFVYLQDVTDISSQSLSITLRSPARNMTVTCGTPIEQRTWLEGLVQLCPLANIDGIRATIRLPEGRERESKSTAAKEVHNTDKKGRVRGDDQELEEEGEQGVAPQKAASSPTRTELKSMKYRNEPDPNEGSVSGPRTSNSRERERDSRDREDHRLTGFHPGAGSGSGTTSRLHQHINNEKSGSLRGKSGEGEGEEEQQQQQHQPPQQPPPQQNSSQQQPTRTTTDSTNSLRTSRTEWFEGGEVHLSGDSRAPPMARNDSSRSEYGGPSIDDIDDLGEVEAEATQGGLLQPEEGSKQQCDPLGGNPDVSMRNPQESFTAAEAKETRQRERIDDLLALDDGGGGSIRNGISAPRDRKGDDSDSDGNDGGLDLAKEKQRLADIKARGEAKANIVTGGSGQKQEAPTPSPRSLSLDYGSHSNTPLTGRSRSNSILEQHLIERESRNNMYPAASTQPQPPSDEKPPYAQKVAASASASASSATTPTTAEAKGENTSLQTKGVPLDAKQLSSEQLARFGFGQGVAADDNWLDDDFDA